MLNSVSQTVTQPCNRFTFTVSVSSENNELYEESAHVCSELRSCVNREVGLGSRSLSLSALVLNKPDSFCGCKAPLNEEEECMYVWVNTVIWCSTR